LGTVTGLLAEGPIAQAMHTPHALARSGEFDIGLNQLDWLPLAFA
jgi:hypothetical protein